jgi:hypothetical protein
MLRLQLGDTVHQLDIPNRRFALKTQILSRDPLDQKATQLDAR